MTDLNSDQGNEDLREADPSKTEGSRDIPENSENSAPAPEQDRTNLVDPNTAYASPTVPMTLVSSDRPALSVIINPSVMQALAQDTPQELLKFAEASDERQFKYYMQKEQNRHKEQLASENTTRIAVGAVLGAVFAAFTYSAITGDSTLSGQIIAVIVGGFGGLGVGLTKVFRPKEDEE